MEELAGLFKGKKRRGGRVIWIDDHSFVVSVTSMSFPRQFPERLMYEMLRYSIYLKSESIQSSDWLELFVFGISEAAAIDTVQFLCEIPSSLYSEIRIHSDHILSFRVQ